MKNATSIIFDLQPQLENEVVKLMPLKPEDFEKLYKVASDQLIWEQHPNKNRYQREVFKTFFEGAIESNGAFIIYNNKTNELIGSSRFYKLENQPNAIAIGYTFFSKTHWGGTYNQATKELMINHAFKFVENVIFQIGASNIRSQKAIERLGAQKIGEENIEYYGEESKLNYIYEIKKINWNGVPNT